MASEPVLAKLGENLRRALPWHKLPPAVGLPCLVEFREQLRKENLFDTSGVAAEPPPESVDSHLKGARTVDGSYNDLGCPHMGAVGTRFGRNVPIELTWPDNARLLDPNPRTISLKLMTRDEFRPATILNLLAAAWIQFMTHDWFSHGRGPAGNAIEIPLASSDPWPEHPMRVPRTPADPTRNAASAGLPPTYVNEVTHWWDGSQIYGSDAATAKRVRAFRDGKLGIGGDGRVLTDAETGVDVTGFNDNWWVGLSLMHSLFIREHNAICDRLLRDYPNWSDEQVFQKARLVNAALMAKIHTIEWTPAILPNPVTDAAMHANWSGLLTEEFRQAVGRLGDSEILSGIPGSPADHNGVPFAMTEEFVAMYRLHPLMPDDYTFRSLATGETLAQVTLPEIAGKRSRDVLGRIPLADLFYSFGISHPGAVTLHNYPRHLQHLVRDNGEIFDLAAVDVLRDRERGIPRYNEFRKLVHMDPIASFEELTDNKQWVAELKEIYGNDVSKLDLMVGMFAETPPEGFGFSETAFRIFILMASRRLKSDRFITGDFTPEVYTPAGMDWVNANGMQSVLLRHHPELAPALEGVRNPFAPWKKLH